MKFDVEWQEAPGVRDRVLAATWARASILVGTHCATEVIDLRANGRRLAFYGSLFPLALWVTENWWFLTHEPVMGSPLPSGRRCPPHMHRWMQRHNLLAARDGGALPDLTMARDGREILVRWDPDPDAGATGRIRFVGQGEERVEVADVVASLGNFVDAVIDRLQENLASNEEVVQLAAAREAIRTASPSESSLCAALAVIGVDAYDPEDASDELVALIERCNRELPDPLRGDLLEGSDAKSVRSNYEWVDRSRVMWSTALQGSSYFAASMAVSVPPHEAGYQLARTVRRDVLEMGTEPLLDLSRRLTERLGWSRECTRYVAGPVSLDGLVGLETKESRPVLMTSGSRSNNADRFRLARAAFFPASGELSASSRLVTSAVTPLQRASRAFAAELLAPADALAQRMSGRVSDEQVEQIAFEFQVSHSVIRHQVENHGIGWLGS